MLTLQNILFEDFKPTDFDVLYHATPSSNVEQILNNGLEVRAENKIKAHDKAIFLVSSKIDAWSIAFQLNQALRKKNKKTC